MKAKVTESKANAQSLQKNLMQPHPPGATHYKKDKNETLTVDGKIYDEHGKVFEGELGPGHTYYYHVTNDASNGNIKDLYVKMSDVA